MKNNKLEFNIIIALNILRDIIEIFSGPFLTAYFIKTSAESIVDLSIFNIFSYFILLVCSVFVGYIIKNRFKIASYRLGIIFNFIYILSIILLNDQIMHYLWLVAILYGISTSFYYMPFNFFLTKKIQNEDRTAMEVRKKFLSTITNILIPIFLGSMITITNYRFTALIILAISFIQIILSFMLKPIEKTHNSFNIKDTIKKIKTDVNAMRVIVLAFLSGLTLSSGALITINTILIYNVMKSDLNLGLIVSITSIFQVIVAYLYKKRYNKKNDKLLVLVLGIVPIIVLSIYLIFRNNITSVLYYVIFNIIINLLSMIHTIKLFNVINKPTFNNSQIEFLSYREVWLNFGRMTGFLLLLLVGLCYNYTLLFVLTIILTISLIVFGGILKNIDKND